MSEVITPSSPGDRASQDRHVYFFTRSEEGRAELPPPPPEENRTPRDKVERWLKERPVEKAFIKRDLTYHGALHCTSTAVIAAVIYETVPFPRDPRLKEAAVIAAATHDSRRTGDWELGQRPHARRGERYMNDHGHDLLPDEELRSMGAAAIGSHSLTRQQKKQRKVERDEVSTLDEEALAQKLSELSPAEMVEKIVHQADSADLQRAFSATRKALSYSALARTVHRAKSRIPRVKDRPSGTERHMIFPQVKALLPLIDAMNWMARNDPSITEEYKDDPIGAMLEAAQRVGFLS